VAISRSIKILLAAFAVVALVVLGLVVWAGIYAYQNHIFGRLAGHHRLDRIEMVPLRAPLADAIALYGEPLEESAAEDFPEAKVYGFDLSEYHGVDVYVWKDKIHQVVYFSAYAEPGDDLRAVLKFYGEGKKWSEFSKGYNSRRNDLDRWAWYSVMPIIGVGTQEYRDGKREYEKRMEEKK
jgi:hypothetical protein